MGGDQRKRVGGSGLPDKSRFFVGETQRPSFIISSFVIFLISLFLIRFGIMIIVVKL